jgi:hypothetical protein
MTATPPGPPAERTEHTEPTPTGRTGALTLASALLLAVSGLFAIPTSFFSVAYYTDTWAVAAVTVPLLALTTLVVAAAAVARGSRTFLLLVSAGTGLHLAGLVVLTLMASGDAGLLSRTWAGLAQLALALVGLALAWWNVSRAEHRPLAPLLLLTLAPLLGQVISRGVSLDRSWWPVLIALAIPLALMVLAAGLVCLPGRRPRITGAALILLAGLGLYGSHLLLATQPQPYRFAVMGLALVCAVAGIVVRPGPGDAADTPTHPGPETEDRPGDVAGRTRVLPVVALVVLVLTVGLDVARMFTQGPGIQPSGAGLVHLVGLLVGAAVTTALTLAAGAATLGSRGMLVVASVASGLLGLALLVSRTAAGGTVALHEGLPFVALGLSLALAWTGVLRPEAGGTTLRWVAVLPLVLAAPALQLLIDPGLTMHASNPAFVLQLVLPILVSGLGPLLAAALLGFPHRRARIAAAVLLGLVAIAAVIGTVENAASGLRVLTALSLLQVVGYALACVLVVGMTLAPKPGR